MLSALRFTETPLWLINFAFITRIQSFPISKRNHAFIPINFYLQTRSRPDVAPRPHISDTGFKRCIAFIVWGFGEHKSNIAAQIFVGIFFITTYQQASIVGYFSYRTWIYSNSIFFGVCFSALKVHSVNMIDWIMNTWEVTQKSHM